MSNKQITILLAAIILFLIGALGIERVRECREKGGAACDLSPVFVSR
jgi:hypothetical protein